MMNFFFLKELDDDFVELINTQKDSMVHRAAAGS